MKKIYSLIAALAMTMAVSAQTLTVADSDGSVAYQFASDGSDMTLSGSSSLTIGSKTFDLNEFCKLSIDESTVTDNTVTVTYSSSGASVKVAGNIAPYVTATVSGGHVAIQTTVADVTYTLSGSSSNGSFYLDGDYASSIVMSGLTLTNPDSCAVNLQGNKLMTMQITGTNTLTDGLSGTDDDTDAHKAALYVNGASQWSGSGTLTLYGKVKHGLCTDDYMILNSGTIKVASSVSDGFHLKNYYQQNDGTVTLTGLGTDGFDVNAKSSSTYSNNGGFEFNGGTLNVTATGDGCKAIKMEGNGVIAGGTITATTSGDCSIEETNGVKDTSSCAGLKGDGTLTMSGGTVTLTSSGDGGKGVNFDGDINFKGGTLSVSCTGSEDVAKPKGVKTDGYIYISGGSFTSASTNARACDCASSDRYPTISGSPTTKSLAKKKVVVIY